MYFWSIITCCVLDGKIVYYSLLVRWMDGGTDGWKVLKYYSLSE